MKNMLVWAAVPEISDPLSYISGYIHTSIAHRNRVNRNGAGYENMYICNALIFYHYL